MGNLGLNSVLQASETDPVSIYAKDFDANGSIDPFISRYIEGKEHSVHYRETMTSQIAGLRRILNTYEAYGQMEMGPILDFLGKEEMFGRRANWFASSYMENLGNGNFSLRPLPLSAQVSPINGITVCDLNGDGHLDFLAVGNSFTEETLSGNYDAGIGICALGNGDGTFTLLTPTESGFCVRSDAKAISAIEVGGKRKWVITSNQAPVRMFGEAQEAALEIQPVANAK